MAKQSGLGCNLYVGGNDISGDIAAIDKISGGPALIDSTDITQLAAARLGGQRSGEIDITSYFDPVTAHPVLSAIPTADVITTVFVNPLALGSPAASQVSKQVGYDPTRGSNGSLTNKSLFQSNAFGLEWGIQLTPGKRTDTSATAASSANSFDTGGSLSNGGQAYLQLFSITGTSVDVSIWDSADNVTFAAVVGLDFGAQAAAPFASRLVISNVSTIRRYVAVATVGTFSNAVFAVHLSKNTVAGVVF